MGFGNLEQNFEMIASKFTMAMRYTNQLDLLVNVNGTFFWKNIFSLTIVKLFVFLL